MEFCSTTGELVVYTTITRLSQEDLSPNSIALFDSYSTRLYLGNFSSEEDYKVDIDIFNFTEEASLIFSGFSEKNKLRRVGYYLPSLTGGLVVQVIAKLANGSTDELANFEEICPAGASSINQFEPKYGGLKDILISTAFFLGRFERKAKALGNCKARFPNNSKEYDDAKNQFHAKYEADYKKVKTKVSEIFFDLQRPNIVEKFQSTYNWMSNVRLKLPKEDDGRFGAAELCQEEVDRIINPFDQSELEVIPKILKLK